MSKSELTFEQVRDAKRMLADLFHGMPQVWVERFTENRKVIDSMIDSAAGAATTRTDQMIARRKIPASPCDHCSYLERELECHRWAAKAISIEWEQLRDALQRCVDIDPNSTCDGIPEARAAAHAEGARLLRSFKGVDD